MAAGYGRGIGEVVVCDEHEGEHNEQESEHNGEDSRRVDVSAD